MGAIQGWTKDPAPDTEVTLIGRGSGIRSRKVLRVEKDGTIITTRISQPGDGGAPVITTSRELLGFLLERREDESVLSPCGPLLEKTGLSLLVNPAGSANLDGALAQIIVPHSDPHYLAKGNEILDAFRSDGIFTPDGTALAKSGSSAQIDVRYYRTEDEELARDFEEKLQKIGFDAIEIWFVEDSDPPAKFIQISLSKAELDGLLDR